MLDTCAYCAPKSSCRLIQSVLHWRRLAWVNLRSNRQAFTRLEPDPGRSVGAGLEKPVIAVAPTIHNVQGTRVDIEKDEKS